MRHPRRTLRPSRGAAQAAESPGTGRAPGVEEAGPDLRRAQPTGSGGVGGAQLAKRASTGRAPGVDDQRGTAILEALAAAVVIGVGVLALSLLSGGIVRANRRSEEAATAALAAANRLELVLAGVPLNAAGDLAPGPHPPDANGAARYEGIGRSGEIVAPSVAAGAAGVGLLRRWIVSEESAAPCLRRVRVSVLDAAADAELASAATLVNCP